MRFLLPARLADGFGQEAYPLRPRQPAGLASAAGAGIHPQALRCRRAQVPAHEAIVPPLPRSVSGEFGERPRILQSLSRDAQ